MATQETLASWLRRQLTRREWNCGDLAERAHVSRASIGRWVNGRELPTSEWAAVAALESVLDVDAILETAWQRFRVSAPAAEAARKHAQERKNAASTRRGRFLGIFGDGIISRAELDVELARAASEHAEAERILASLPELPDEAAIREQWETLRDMADIAAAIPVDRRGDVLRALGVAIVAPSGVRLPGKGGADSQTVQIRVRPELAAFFAENRDCAPFVEHRP